MTKTRDLSDFLIEGGADLPLGVPHIIPGVLQPAVDGKLLDGVTNHSGNYGTAQSDGHSYYYTDIRGSKPIKDPRIGGHFGSQRHKVRSIQLLEQETATHGADVYSVDGREWFRAVGPDWVRSNNPYGNYIYIPTSATTGADFVEIVGYFNAINMSGYGGPDRDITLAIDGTANSSNFTGLTASVASPISGTRYVDGGSVVNLTFDSAPSLGIHTVKIGNVNGDYLGALYGIELITQDTSNRNNIQIPSQNVVSFGKKFNVSGTPHYNPFNNQTIGDTTSHGKNTVGWTTYDSTLDTTTSLGLDAWVNSGNYYRPVNGGRVVKWVDSSGNIKTSVNMMPPSGTANGSESKSDSADPHAHAWTTVYQPKLSSSTIDSSQAEVSKSFHWREFGNGNANGGTSGTYKDLSMFHGNNQDLSYVMDDGLTSMSYDGAYRTDSIDYLRSNNSGGGVTEGAYITFIGTGFTIEDMDGNYRTAQNLPYGTHLIFFKKPPDETLGEVYIDGIKIHDGSYNSMQIKDYINFYQPKKPPIPEDACVLADYMLMADFVGLGASNSNDKREHISKGVRRLSGSRDVLYVNSAFSLVNGPGYSSGFSIRGANNDYSAQVKISFFGDKVVYLFADPVSRLPDNDCTFSSGTKGTTVDVSNNNDHVIGARQFSITDGPRVTTFTADSSNASNSYTTKNGVDALDLATPIHTSSHYQSFETPYLHELIGGDRNMEQTNLVVSPDGKTWDEVTRDTSYIGSNLVSARVDAGTTSGYLYANAIVQWDMWRGNNWQLDCGNKDWAIAYDRIICLKDGEYTISAVILHGASHRTRVRINGSAIILLHETGGNDTGTMYVKRFLKKGDYIDFYDGTHEQTFSHFQISKG